MKAQEGGAMENNQIGMLERIMDLGRRLWIIGDAIEWTKTMGGGQQIILDRKKSGAVPQAGGMRK